MREQLRKATTVIVWQPNFIPFASGNMTPAYKVNAIIVRPVFFYCVDISEFAVKNYVTGEASLITSIVTNIQDFLVTS
jgi:hypothetical protein